MNLFHSIKKRLAKFWSYPVGDTMFHGGYNSAALTTSVLITPEIALTIPQILAAVSFRAQAVSTLSLDVLKQNGRMYTNDKNHRVWHLWNVSPDGVIPAARFRSTLSFHVDTFGNGYAEITRQPNGKTDE